MIVQMSIGNDDVKQPSGGAVGRGRRWSLSLCPLFIGALLLFGGIVSILYASQLWTRIDVEYAEDMVLVLLGIFFVAISVNLKR
jgi:hypothetical protein